MWRPFPAFRKSFVNEPDNVRLHNFVNIYIWTEYVCYCLEFDWQLTKTDKVWQSRILEYGTNSIYVISAAYATSAFPSSSLKLIFNKNRIIRKRKPGISQGLVWAASTSLGIYLILKCEFIYYFSYISQPIVFILNSQSWDAVYYQVVVAQLRLRRFLNPRLRTCLHC